MTPEGLLPDLLVSYWDGEGWGVAVADGGDLAPVSVAARCGRSAMRALLEEGTSGLRRAKAEADARFLSRTGLLDRRSVRLGPTVPDPDKILCVGFNYAEHTAEMQVERPVAPNVFAKFRNSLVAHGDTVPLGTVSTEVDYEGELAVVIGSRCRDVAPGEVDRYIAGFTILNDVTARDLQFRTSQWTLGKAADGFCPVGPGLVPRDRVPDAQDLGIVTHLNGEIVQHGSTRDMVFPVAEVLSEISSVLTLEPGDIVTTGTPSGVGYKANPPRFLRDGDEVAISIDGIGTLSNRFVASAPVAGHLPAHTSSSTTPE